MNQIKNHYIVAGYLFGKEYGIQLYLNRYTFYNNPLLSFRRINNFPEYNIYQTTVELSQPIREYFNT